MKPGSNFLQEIWRMICVLCALEYLFTGFLILLISFGCPRAVAQAIGSQDDPFSTERERICLSMRVLGNEAKKEPLPQEVERLASIGWLEGFVVDPDHRDVVLIGRRALKRPALHMDDLVVNMRNVWNREADPYCSLDPRPEDVRKLNELASRAGTAINVDEMYRFFTRLKENWGQQTVIVGGVPRNSRHAHVMIDADYHMKKVSQGLVKVGGIRSCLDLVCDEAKREIDRTGQIPPLGMSMSRFWFHVGTNEPKYQESKHTVWLERCSVVLLTERQRSTVDGILYDSAESDPNANAFAKELSDHFQEAATQVEEYADLENLFRLRAVLRAMHVRDAVPQARLDLGFWLRDYRCRTDTAMPVSLPGLANSKDARWESTRGAMRYQYVLFPMACGGVSMEMSIDNSHFAATKTEQMNQLRELVLRSRPTQDALSWKLSSSSM